MRVAGFGISENCKVMSVAKSGVVLQRACVKCCNIETQLL